MQSAPIIRTELHWWALSALLGALGWYGMTLLSEELTDQTKLVSAVGGIFLAGSIMGYVKPVKVWRWALACILLHPVVEGIKAQSFSYFLVQIPLAVIPGIPAVAGAYAGMFAAKAVHHTTDTIGMSREKKLWLGGYTVATLLSIPYTLPPELSLPETLIAAGFLFVVAAVLGFAVPVKAWRWGFASGLGLPSIVILRILYDALFGSRSHKLLPIEIILSVLIAFPVSFLGTYLGAGIRRFVFKKDNSQSEKE